MAVLHILLPSVLLFLFLLGSLPPLSLAIDVRCDNFCNCASTSAPTPSPTPPPNCVITNQTQFELLGPEERSVLLFVPIDCRLPTSCLHAILSGNVRQIEGEDWAELLVNEDSKVLVSTIPDFLYLDATVRDLNTEAQPNRATGRINGTIFFDGMGTLTLKFLPDCNMG